MAPLPVRLLVFMLVPLPALGGAGRVETPITVEAAPKPAQGLALPIPIQMSLAQPFLANPAVPAPLAPALNQLPPAAAALAPAAAAAAAAPDALPIDAGRVMFDQSAPRSGTPEAVAGWTAPIRTALPPTAARRAPGVKRRLIETAEVGTYSLSMHAVNGALALFAGSSAVFPAAVGIMWALFGAEMIGHLGRLRPIFGDGWQASHDQRMRHDYGTGKLIDIRGRKYGRDRHDARKPGPVSSRERALVDGAALLSGLPWVVSGGPQAIGVYVLSAAGALFLRRAWAARRDSQRQKT